jgi:hypothetical protein
MSTNCQDPCTDCQPCNETNPCYDNCGCLNPTTWECVTKPGNLSGIGVVASMDGLQVLTAINDKVTELGVSKGKVALDGADTCPEYVLDKLEAGTNISFTQTGTGCDRKLVISSSTGGVAVDVNAKVSVNDTTTDYLINKLQGGSFITKTVVSPGGVEKLKFDVVPTTLISTDPNNALGIGTDGKLMAVVIPPPATSVVAGANIAVTGSGSLADPYVIASNTLVAAVKSCYDGVWRDVTLGATGNASVTYVSGTPKYRVRHDGSIEFKGSATYTVAFGAYSTAQRKHVVSIGSIPTSCVTLIEQNGVADLKGINYIDAPGAAADQITQQYGYIVRKNTNNIQVEFQSSFSLATTKTIVVNFEGCISHPNL